MLHPPPRIVTRPLRSKQPPLFTRLQFATRPGIRNATTIRCRWAGATQSGAFHLESSAFRAALSRHEKELEIKVRGHRHGGQTQRENEFDLWVLRNLTFYSTLGLERYVSDILVDRMALLESRMSRVREMAAALRP